MAIPPEQKYPADRRQHRELSSDALHCHVTRNDVHNHWPAKCKRQRYVPADAKQTKLSRTDPTPPPVEAWVELHERIQSKHKEQQSEKDSGNNRDDLHGPDRSV